jgi:hypothetical protein
MKKGTLILLTIIILLLLLGTFIYINYSNIDEGDARKAVSNYLYENKIGECESDSNDNYIYGNDCEDYYQCYSEGFSQYVSGTQINEIKNNLNENGLSSQGLTYEQIKIIPEIENNDQYDIYEIKNKCFIEIYENKGLVSSSGASNYFKELSKKSLQENSFCSNTYKISDTQICNESIECLINAINSRMSSSEVTALANYIKTNEERYNIAGLEIFREIKVLEDADLRDFTEQCGKV